MSEWPELCRVCNQSRGAHEDTDIHHVFSTDGQLVQKSKPKPKPANARPHIVAPSNEPCTVRLAAILHTKGVISEAELVYILTGGERPDGRASGHSTTGDLSTGVASAAG